LVGDSVTIADFVLYAGSSWLLSETLDGIAKSSMDPYPLVSAHCNRIKEIPEVAAFLKKYPEPFEDFDYDPEKATN